MANQRSRILAALNIQAAHEGETDNIKACRIILGHAKSDNDWQTLVNVSFHRYGVRFHRYGVLSYETHRFYYVRDWVMPMVVALAGTDLALLPSNWTKMES